MPLYQFDCVCGDSFEALAHRDDKRLSCQSCGKWAYRAEVYAVSFSMGGASTITRQRYRDFDEASHEVDHAYTEAEKVEPRVRRPDFYGEGVQQAKKRGAKINGGH